MDAGSPHPVVEDPGTAVSGERLESRMPNDYGVLSSDAALRPIQTFHGDVSYPHTVVNSQEDSNSSPYRLSGGEGNFTLPVPQSFTSGAVNSMVDMHGNEAYGAPRSAFEDSIATGNFNAQYAAYQQSLQDLAHVELRHSMTVNQAAPRVVPPGTIFINGAPRHVYPVPGPGLQSLGAPAMVPPGYQIMTQAPAGFSVPAETQHVSSVGVPPIYPQALPRSAPYIQFPQPGVSPMVGQYERRHRAQGLAVNATGINAPRSSVHNSRRRARRADEAGPQQPHRLSHPPLQAAQSRSLYYPEGLTPRAGDVYPMLSPRQRAEMEREVQLGELLRNIQADERRAFEIYEESLLHSRRYHQGTNGVDSSPPSKGLDNQNDGRPEPKESKDLTVNLECKACMTQLVDTVVLPCGHAILCRWCADQHMPSLRNEPTRPKGHATCPMCRAPVKQKVRIYLS